MSTLTEDIGMRNSTPDTNLETADGEISPSTPLPFPSHTFINSITTSLNWTIPQILDWLHTFALPALKTWYKTSYLNTDDQNHLRTKIRTDGAPRLYREVSKLVHYVGGKLRNKEMFENNKAAKAVKALAKAAVEINAASHGDMRWLSVFGCRDAGGKKIAAALVMDVLLDLLEGGEKGCFLCLLRGEVDVANKQMGKKKTTAKSDKSKRTIYQNGIPVAMYGGKRGGKLLAGLHPDSTGLITHTSGISKEPLPAPEVPIFYSGDRPIDRTVYQNDVLVAIYGGENGDTLLAGRHVDDGELRKESWHGEEDSGFRAEGQGDGQDALSEQADEHAASNSKTAAACPEQARGEIIEAAVDQEHQILTLRKRKRSVEDNKLPSKKIRGGDEENGGDELEA